MNVKRIAWEAFEEKIEWQTAELQGIENSLVEYNIGFEMSPRLRMFTIAVKKKIFNLLFNEQLFQFLSSKIDKIVNPLGHKKYTKGSIDNIDDPYFKMIVTKARKKLENKKKQKLAYDLKNQVKSVRDIEVKSKSKSRRGSVLSSKINNKIQNRNLLQPTAKKGGGGKSTGFRKFKKAQFKLSLVNIRQKVQTKLETKRFERQPSQRTDLSVINHSQSSKNERSVPYTTTSQKKSKKSSKSPGRKRRKSKRMAVNEASNINIDAINLSLLSLLDFKRSKAVLKNDPFNQVIEQARDFQEHQILDEILKKAGLNKQLKKLGKDGSLKAKQIRRQSIRIQDSLNNVMTLEKLSRMRSQSSLKKMDSWAYLPDPVVQNKYKFAFKFDDQLARYIVLSYFEIQRRDRGGLKVEGDEEMKFMFDNSLM